MKYLPLELLEFTNIYRALEKIQPDEIYNPGAQSFVTLSFKEPIFTADTQTGEYKLGAYFINDFCLVKEVGRKKIREDRNLFVGAVEMTSVR